MKKNKHIEYSKILASASLIIFLLTLTISLFSMIYIMINGDPSLIDATIFVTSISVTGSLYGVTVKHYYSKSGLQNVAQIRKDTYREVMKVRLDYDEEKLKLINKYNVDECTIDEIEANAPFKDMSDSVIGQMTDKLNEVDSVNEAEPEIETY
jgi:hypothetical protein